MVLIIKNINIYIKILIKNYPSILNVAARNIHSLLYMYQSP